MVQKNLLDTQPRLVVDDFAVVIPIAANTLTRMALGKTSVTKKRRSKSLTI
ncbi:hypothetical protein QFZ85_004980 [Pseudomonas frederiksbergensis]